MKNRIALRNETHGVEFPENSVGFMQVKAFRRSHPEFKKRRIRSILQMKPSEVPMGEVYLLT